MSLHCRDSSSDPYAGDYYYYSLNLFGEGAFIIYTADQYDIFNWSFYTYNETIDIRAMAMDESNFNQYIDDGEIYNYHIDFELLSDNLVRNYGSFNPSHSGTWYFVFIHTEYPLFGIPENSKLSTLYVVVEHIKNLYEEPEPEPEQEQEPAEVIERNDNIIPFIIGFAIIGLVVGVVLISIGYRIKVRKSNFVQNE